MKMLFGAVIVLVAAAIPASAQSLIFTLNQDGCSGGCGAAAYGAITLTRTNPNQISVFETLNSDFETSVPVTVPVATQYYSARDIIGNVGARSGWPVCSLPNGKPA